MVAVGESAEEAEQVGGVSVEKGELRCSTTMLNSGSEGAQSFAERPVPRTPGL